MCFPISGTGSAGMEAAFVNVTEMDPAYVDGWVNVARAQIQEGDVSAAEPTLRHALTLDGTLARFRNRQRPRYGFYVDHVVDAVGTFFLLGGMALGEHGYVRMARYADGFVHNGGPPRTFTRASPLPAALTRPALSTRAVFGAEEA